MIAQEHLLWFHIIIDTLSGDFDEIKNYFYFLTNKD